MRGLIALLSCLSLASSVTLNVTWTFPGPIADQTATVGDTVSFNWVSGHTVGLFPSLAAYTACNFTRASAITVSRLIIVYN
jgi:hypothetical protein